MLLHRKHLRNITAPQDVLLGLESLEMAAFFLSSHLMKPRNVLVVCMSFSDGTLMGPEAAGREPEK